MSVTSIRAVPRELPHADIYLDDLFEVEEIFSRNFEKLARPVEVSFQYTLNGELRMTAREDLVNHGGHCSQFGLCLVRGKGGSGSEVVLRFYSSLRPAIDIPYDLREEQWPIYGQIEQIFRSRAGKLKRVTASVPKGLLYGLDGALGALLIMAGPVLLFVIAKHYISPYYLLALFGFLLIYAPVLILVRSDKREDRVYFQYRRDDQKARESTRKEWTQKVIMLLLGALVGIAGTLLTKALVGSR